MDKLLETKFVLKGARNPQTPTPPTHNNSAMSTDGTTHLPPVFKTSPLFTETSSGTDSDSYTTPKHSHDHPHTAPAQHQNRRTSPTTTENEEEEAVIAYYIQPGGRIVPVNIHPDVADSPTSQRASIDTATQTYTRTQAHAHTHTQGRGAVVGTGAAMVVRNSADLAPEGWLDEDRGGERVRADSAEHLAVLSDLTPAWMGGR
jgi:hypothetical protein